MPNQRAAARTTPSAAISSLVAAGAADPAVGSPIVSPRARPTPFDLREALRPERIPPARSRLLGDFSRHGVRPGMSRPDNARVSTINLATFRLGRQVLEFDHVPARPLTVGLPNLSDIFPEAEMCAEFVLLAPPGTRSLER